MEPKKKKSFYEFSNSNVLQNLQYASNPRKKIGLYLIRNFKEYFYNACALNIILC